MTDITTTEPAITLSVADAAILAQVHPDDVVDEAEIGDGRFLLVQRARQGGLPFLSTWDRPKAASRYAADDYDDWHPVALVDRVSGHNFMAQVSTHVSWVGP